MPLGSIASGTTIDKAGITRLSGADRYETAATISRASFSSPSVVFLASGENYPDALSGGSAAAHAGAPVLLTKRSTLPAATKKELARTSPATIFILGGTSSITKSVASAPAAHAGTVVRLAGKDRYATAVAISKRSWASSDVVDLASGSGYADALSGGALAAKSGAPVLLSSTRTLPSIVAKKLKRLAPSKVVLLGGTASLTSNVETAVKTARPKAAVSRVAGADRYAASAAIAAEGWSTSTRAFYNNGLDFPDALAGVPAIAANDAPLLLTKKTCMPAAIATATKNLKPTIKILLGGTRILDNNGATKVCPKPAPKPARSSVGKYRTDVVRYTNAARKKNGLAVLSTRACLTKYAQKNADRMATQWRFLAPRPLPGPQSVRDDQCGRKHCRGVHLRQCGRDSLAQFPASSNKHAVSALQEVGCRSCSGKSGKIYAVQVFGEPR